MPDIPTKEPLSFDAGDLVTWKITDSDYPASDGYVLKYYLVKADSDLITLTSTADGDDHLIEIPAATSITYDSGNYNYQKRIELSTTIITRGKGLITINPNFAAKSSGYDARVHAQIVLDNLNAVIEGKATQDNLSYSIAGRSLNKYSPGELMEWKDYYERQLNNLEIELGRKSSRKIQVKFTEG